MSRLTLAQAQQVLIAAVSEARARGFRPMGVVVVDELGQIKAVAREDGASALRLEIARGKAGAAIGMGVNSRALVQPARDNPTFFGSIAASAQQPFLPQTGAVLIRDASGEIIGATAASGGTGDEDEQIVIAGITATGLKHG